MVDLWLLYCIIMNFLIILLHALIDFLLHEENERNMATPKTKRAMNILDHKVQALPVRSVNNEEAWSDASGSIHTPVFTLRRFILFSRVAVFAIFFIFSLFYWGFILS